MQKSGLDEVATPPVATASSHTTHDEFAWMKNSQSPESCRHLDAERTYYEARMKPLSSTIALVYEELVARTPPEQSGAPWQERGFRYWKHTPEGADLPRLIRADADGDEDVLLDLTEVATSAGSTYADLGSFAVSPDDTLLAWAVDTSGAELFDLRIRDLRTGRDLPVHVEGTHYGIAWSADSRWLFYVLPDDAWRPHEIYRVDVRTGETAMVISEPDERFFLEVEQSRAGEWIVITSSSRRTTEVWTVPADDPGAPPVSLAGRTDGLEYRVEHDAAADRWLIVTNRDSAEFDIMTVPLRESEHSSVDDWTPWLVAGPGERLHAAWAFSLGENAVIVVEGRRDGAGCVRVLEPDGSLRHELLPDGPAHALAVGINVDPALPFVTVTSQSYVAPPSWWDVDLVTGERTLRHRRDVPGLDPGDYAGEVVRIPSHDGWSIPVVVVRHRSTPLDGTAPCLLYAYGSYESVDDPEFDIALLPLLDRGVVFAKAHIRGGGEVGRAQWLDGRMDRKWNTFRDFAAVAAALGTDVEGRGPLVDGSCIVGRGGSAGGLLQGVSYGTWPELFAGIVAEVPFVDVVNSMSDTNIPLTVNEWEEWGSPFVPEQRDYLMGYAPYENIPDPEGRPALLVTGAVHDPRVLVHEPAKWVARLRTSDPRRGAGLTGLRPAEPGVVLFRVELAEGSHGGPAGRYSALRVEAEIDAWILAALGRV